MHSRGSLELRLGTIGFFLILNRAAVGDSQSRKCPWRRSQFYSTRERLPCEGCHAFWAHIAHRQWEHFTKSLIFSDAWIIPLKLITSKSLTSFNTISFKTSKNKAYNKMALIFKHKAGKGDHINGINMFQEKNLVDSYYLHTTTSRGPEAFLLWPRKYGLSQ